MGDEDANTTTGAEAEEELCTAMGGEDIHEAATDTQTDDIGEEEADDITDDIADDIIEGVVVEEDIELEAAAAHRDQNFFPLADDECPPDLLLLDASFWLAAAWMAATALPAALPPVAPPDDPVAPPGNANWLLGTDILKEPQQPKPIMHAMPKSLRQANSQRNYNSAVKSFKK